MGSMTEARHKAGLKSIQNGSSAKELKVEEVDV
jgi:hypothetical protein